MLDQIKEILATSLSIDADSITEASSFSEDLGIDSLDIVELLMTLEDKYGVIVPDDEVTNLKTIGDIAEYIEANK